MTVKKQLHPLVWAFFMMFLRYRFLRGQQIRSGQGYRHDSKRGR